MSNHYVIYIKLIQCYMSIISELKIYIQRNIYIKKLPILPLLSHYLIAMFERKGTFILRIVAMDAKGGAFIT